MNVFATTGHRPDKLGGYGLEIDNALRDLARWYLASMRPDRVISGVALGWDMAFAEAAIELDIPVVAAVPFAGQERKWPTASQRRYQAILNSSEVVIVSEGEYSADKMRARNIWMVLNSSQLVALWDGSRDSGTGHCVRYAKSRDVDVVNLWPLWSKNKGL